MKIKSVFLASLIVIIISGLVAGCSKEAMDVEKVGNTKKVKVTAHSGCMKTPADSLESVKLGVEIKADICEIDINLLSDGTTVLKHDAVLPDDKNLVKVTEVFEYVKDKNMGLNLDIKNFNAVGKIADEVLKYGLEEKAFLTGISKDRAEILKSSNYKVRYYLNQNLENKLFVSDYNKYIDGLIDTMKSLNCIGLNSNYMNVNSEAVERIQKAGLLVSVWTVDEPELMKKFVDMGVDNITTKNPEAFFKIVNSK